MPTTNMMAIRRSRLAVAVCGLLASSAVGCAFYSPHSAPLTDLKAGNGLLGRNIRFYIDQRSVTLHVDSITFRWVGGRVREADGAPVRFDLREARRVYGADTVRRNSGILHVERRQRLSLDSIRLDPG